MDAVIEYIIVGVIALSFAFVTTPVLLEFYFDAVNATEQEDGSEATIIALVLLLVLAMFYFFLVWILYGAVQNKIDNM